MQAQPTLTTWAAKKVAQAEARRAQPARHLTLKTEKHNSMSFQSDIKC